MTFMYKRSVQLPEEEFELLKELFGCKYEEEGVNSVKTRLEHDYYISNVLKILLPLSKGRLRYQELYRRSKIRSEDSFLKYLRWMLRIGLLDKEDVYYVITTRGTKLVEAFR
ncbi:MAG: hypothetical protein KatS3mg003_0075 [Candidatus Nitrosocaldaceae archaeon]|nr:MAG: hypothetical protein KatS3mg003_0075 [Candidatus Nitrosocaldaceae archaeon]